MTNPAYKVDTQKGVTIVTLTNETVTMHENEELKQAFSELLEKGSKNIILDLSNIIFISTLVIASLVYMLKRTKESDGDLVMCTVKDKVKEVLHITNLDKIFTLFDDKQQALKHFTK